MQRDYGLSNVHNYDIKLSTVPATKIEKEEIDVKLDWSDIDVMEHLNMRIKLSLV